MSNAPKKTSLRSPFSSTVLQLINERLYAPEDSAIFYHAIARATRAARDDRPGENVGLVDICSGKGIAPLQALERGLVDEFWGMDIMIDNALELRKKLQKLLPYIDWQNTAHFNKANILDTQSVGPVITEARQKTSNLIVAANPPWVPAPPRNELRGIEGMIKILTHMSEHGVNVSVIPAIFGGKDGLRFYPAILDIADKCKAERVCLNVASIDDIRKLTILLKEHSLKPEFVEALETMSYGLDATPDVRKHIENGIAENYFRKEGEDFKYIIMGLSLKKSESKKEISEGIAKLRALLEAYKNGQVETAADDSFCRLWELTKKDKKRMEE